MALRERLSALRAARGLDFEWAQRKFDDHYRRFDDDEFVADGYGLICDEVIDRLQAGRTGYVGRTDAQEAGELVDAIAAGRASPEEVRERSGLGMELPVVLHRLTGGHRDEYLRLIAQLPVSNGYQPSYMTMGPTGKCNVVCPDCIIGGAIFKKERQLLADSDDVLPILAQAEEAGIRSVSFCIGEPTYNTRILFDAFDRIRDSDVLTARSMVTNGLFARKLDKAVRFFEGVREHLGGAKARQLMVGLSLNDDLRNVGVPVEATANVLEAYAKVFPDHRLMLQLIMDEGFHRIQNELFEELGRRGLLEGWRDLLLDSEGSHGELRLTCGLRVIVSVMRKQPSLHNPWAREGEDPWVRYFTPQALVDVPLKGLYTYDDEDETEPGDGGLVVHRITLGPDGVLYPDYHFMVAAARPLGTTMKTAIGMFRRDPILGILLERGGLNVLLSTYMAIPARERVLADVYEPCLRCSTAGMVAANVLFGDYEVALQLTARILQHGLTAPRVESTALDAAG